MLREQARRWRLQAEQTPHLAAVLTRCADGLDRRAMELERSRGV